MRKRIPEYGEDIREVDQQTHQVDITCDILETKGLGPCIGVAVVYSRRLSLAHYPNAVASEFEGFFDELAAAIPKGDRANVRPVVAGGKPDTGLEDGTADRQFVLQKLRDLGFGEPHVHWCTEQEDCHELELDAVDGAILVTSRPTDRFERIPF
jgi:hypothetical protein